MLCVVGHAGALTRRAGPSTDHSNPNTNYNVSIYLSIKKKFRLLSFPLPPPPRFFARGAGPEDTCYFALER